MSDTQSSNPHKGIVKVFNSIGLVIAVAAIAGLIADFAALISTPLHNILLLAGAVIAFCVVCLIVRYRDDRFDRILLSDIGSFIVVLLAGAAIGAGVRGPFATPPKASSPTSGPSASAPSPSPFPPKREFVFCSSTPRPPVEGVPSGSGGRICSPARGARVEQAIEVTGEAEQPPADHELWLFIDPAGKGRYLPGNGVWNGETQLALRVDASGSWGQGDVELGSIDDKPGGKFTLALVILGPEGVKRMNTYFANRETDGIDRDQIVKLQGTRHLDTIKLERA